MKITTLLTLAVILCNMLPLNGQNWAPFDPEEGYAYTRYGDTDPKHFVYPKELSDSVYQIGNYAEADPSGMLITYSNSIIPRAGEPIPLGHLCKITSNQEYLYYQMGDLSQPSFVIKPNLALHDTFLLSPLYSQQGHVLYTGTQMIFNQLDSVKIIAAIGGQDTFILSKNHGLLEYSYAGEMHHLTGMHKAQKGNYLPRFKDFYEFQVGDIFVILNSTWMATKSAVNTGTRRKITILSKTETDSGFIYLYKELKYGYYDDMNGPGPFYTYGPPYTGLVNIHPGGEAWGGITGFADQHPGALYKASVPLNYYDFPVYYITSLENDSSGYYLSTNDFLYEDYDPMDLSDTLYTSLEAFGSKIEAHPGLGITQSNFIHFEFSYQYKLQAYVRNGDTVGNIPTDSYMLGVGDETENAELHVYPNPVSDLLHIQSTVAFEEVEVMSLDGRLLIHQQQSNSSTMELQLDQLPKGYYLLRITDEKGNSYLRKVLKTE